MDCLHIAPQLNDSVIDSERNLIVIADEGIGRGGDGSKGVLNVVNTKSGISRRILEGHSSTRAYLFLVAQYESWSIPLSVLYITPVAVPGALLAISLRHLSMDLYARIGLIMLIGLTTKQAILMVQFAKEAHEKEGVSVLEAAKKAASLRFRSVMMTSLSFILGVLPLVIASGAGANARQSLGTVVFGGMILASVLGTLLIPGFFTLMRRDAKN